VVSGSSGRHRDHRRGAPHQYDVLALNMRNALPNAGFLGFTGTPLIAGEERTARCYGDYVSVYNFADSARDAIRPFPCITGDRIPQLQDRQSDLRPTI